MLFRPPSHGLETGNKSVAGGTFIQILHVHHLETRLIHLMVWIEVRICGQLRIRDHFHNRRMSKLPSLRIVEHINLDLPNATSQLVTEWSMTIVQTSEGLRMIHLQKLALAGCKSSVIAIV